MLVAAKESPSCKRMVYAASSSTYGESAALPKIEGQAGKPLSPYAVTKAVNECYANVFSRVYGFHTIGLRYFNVFGPKQNANNPYAAVIPIFCKHFIEGSRPIINGDVTTSRDFTFVENVIQANIKVLFDSSIVTGAEIGVGLKGHEVFNVACGDQTTLNDMIVLLCEIGGKKIEVIKGPERTGGKRHSKASIEKLAKFCGYDPKYSFREGIEIAYDWYKEKYS